MNERQYRQLAALDRLLGATRKIFATPWLELPESARARLLAYGYTEAEWEPLGHDGGPPLALVRSRHPDDVGTDPATPACHDR